MPPYVLYLVYIHIGWVGVGWRRRYQTRLSLRELDIQGAVLFCLCLVFWRLPWLAVELDHVCAGRTLNPPKGDDRIT